MQMTINKLVTIKDYLFQHPVIIRDDKRFLLKSDYVKKEENQNSYFVEIIQGIYTDEELFTLCEPDYKKGGRVHKQQNGVIQITIYK